MDSSPYGFDVFCLDPKQRKLLFRIYARSGESERAREITEKVLRESPAEQIDFTDAAGFAQKL